MNKIDDFLNYLRYERNRSELTVTNYGRSLKDFESFFKDRDSQLSWESIDSDIIRDWVEGLMDKGDMASTVNNCLSAVRSFFRFALSRGLVSSDPAHAIKGPKKQKMLPQFLREEEMDRLIDGEEMQGDGYKAVLARTLIILFYETGIRLAELIGLDDGDVDFTNHRLKVTGKRNKQRIIPFGQELEEALKDYIRCRDEALPRKETALMVSEKGRRMTRIQVETIVKRQLSLVTTMKKRSPHVLRHAFATAMLNNGAGLEGIKNLLGHESVSTTEIYTHTTFEQLKRVYKEAHPRA